MAGPSSPQHEPTMEEILASIRKIISEDSSESSKQFTPDADPRELQVLELTQEDEEEIPASPKTSATAPAENVLEAPSGPGRDTVHESIGETSVTTQASSHSSEGIFSEKTRRTLSDVFNGLTPPAAEQVAPVTGLSLETVFERAVREAFDPVLQKWLNDNADKVIERMKPTISEWLDEHFPAMLEDAVRNEVARAVKARGRR